MGEISIRMEEVVETLKCSDQCACVPEHTPCLEESCGTLLLYTSNGNPIVLVFLTDPKPQGVPEQAAVTLDRIY